MNRLPHSLFADRWEGAVEFIPPHGFVGIDDRWELADSSTDKTREIEAFRQVLEWLRAANAAKQSRRKPRA